MLSEKQTLTISQAIMSLVPPLKALKESLIETTTAFQSLLEIRAENSDEISDALDSEMIERAEKMIEAVSDFFDLSDVFIDTILANADLSKTVEQLKDRLKAAKDKRETLEPEAQTSEE